MPDFAEYRLKHDQLPPRESIICGRYWSYNLHDQCLKFCWVMTIQKENVMLLVCKFCEIMNKYKFRAITADKNQVKYTNQRKGKFCLWQNSVKEFNLSKPNLLTYLLCVFRNPEREGTFSAVESSPPIDNHCLSNYGLHSSRGKIRVLSGLYPDCS